MHWSSWNIRKIIKVRFKDIQVAVGYGMGNVSVGDYQPIYDNETVCKYVTKHIGKDVDYDIVFKS